MADDGEITKFARVLRRSLKGLKEKFWSRLEYFYRFLDWKLRQISSDGFYFSDNLEDNLRSSDEREWGRRQEMLEKSRKRIIVRRYAQ